MAKPIEIPLVVDASGFASGLGKAAAQVEATAKKMAAATGGDVDAIKKKLLDLEQIKLQTKTLKVDADTASARAELEALSTGGVGGLGKLKQALGGEMKQAVSQLTSSLGPAGSAISEVGMSAGGAGIAIAGAGAAVAGAAIFAKKAVTDFLDLATKVDKFSQITRASAEDSSRFVGVLDDLSISSDAGAKALAQLAQRADSKGFQALGIEVKKTNSGATDLIGTFRNVLVAVEKIPDPIERANILTASFGKSYQELLPLIERGSAGFDALLKGNEKTGQILSQKDIENARAFKAAMDDLKDALEKVFLESGKVLTPLASITAKSLVEGVHLLEVGFGKLFGAMKTVATVSFNTVEQALQGLVDAVDAALGPLVNFDDNLVEQKFGTVAGMAGSVGRSLFAAGDGADALTEATQKALAAAQEHADAIAEENAAAEKQVRAFFAAASAQKDADAAIKALTDHTKEQADAADRASKSAELASKVSKDQAAISAAETQGRKDVASAVAAEEQAKKRVADADAAYQKSLDALGDALGDELVATRNASQANEDYKRTLTGVGVEAQAAKNKLLDLNDAKAGVTSAEIGVRSADRAVQDAKARRAATLDANAVDRERQLLMLRIKETEAGVTRAEEQLAKAKASGTASAEDIADAERNLARTRLEAQGSISGYLSRFKELSDLTDEQSKLNDDVTQAEIAAQRARADLDKATQAAAESQRVYNGTVNGFAEDSPEAITANEKLAEATDKANAARDKVVEKKDAVVEAQSKQTDAANALADAHNAIAEKAKAAKEKVADLVAQLDGDKAKLVAYKNETAKLASAHKDVADEVNGAVLKEAEFIQKTAEASGQTIPYVDAIRLAVEKLKTQIGLSASELSALNAIAAQLPTAAKPTVNSSGGVGSTPYLPAGGTGDKVSPVNKSGGDRNWRNNNPGNIEYGPFAKAHGAIGTDGRFAIFPTMEVGRAALDALLRTSSYGNSSIAAAIQRYAPSSDNNNPNQYAAVIAKAAGVSVNTRLNDLTPAQRQVLLDAIYKMEGGKAGRVIIKDKNGKAVGSSNPDGSLDVGKIAIDGLAPDVLSKLRDAVGADELIRLNREGLSTQEASQQALTALQALGFSTSEAQDAWQMALDASNGDQLKALQMIGVNTAATVDGLSAVASAASSAVTAATATATRDTTFTGGPDNMTIRLYARDPITGGTLFDGNGNPIYADNADAVRAEFERRQREGIAFASGGYVPYRAGGTKIKGIFGERDPKGEIISPVSMMASTMQDVLARRDASGAAGTNIYVTVQAGLVSTPSEIARQIVDVVDPYLHAQGRYASGVLARPS